MDGILGHRSSVATVPSLPHLSGDLACLDTTMRAASNQTTTLLTNQLNGEWDDAMLVSMASVGHPKAHAAIWNRYAPLVRALVRRSIGQESEVEDLVQEVFLRFYRNLRHLRNPGALRSFIFAISLRVTISELRSRRSRRWLRLADTSVSTQGTRFAPPANFEAREAVAGFCSILDRLDPRDRRAFVLYHVEDHELTEVAAALGVSLATVKRRLARIACRVHAMADSDQRLVEYSGKNGAKEAVA